MYLLRQRIFTVFILIIILILPHIVFASNDPADATSNCGNAIVTGNDSSCADQTSTNADDNGTAANLSTTGGNNPDLDPVIVVPEENETVSPDAEEAPPSIEPVKKLPESGPLATLNSIGGEAGYVTNTDNSFFIIVSSLITTALSIVGVAFLILMIYGGFLWMTDRGNEAQAKKALNLIQAAVIGLIIVISAYAITYFVVQTFGQGQLTNMSSQK